MSSFGSAKTGSSVASSGTAPLVYTVCCPQGLPQTLYATFAGGCLDGIEMPLIYSGVSEMDHFVGTEVLPCGYTLEVRVNCGGPRTWNLFALIENSEEVCGAWSALGVEAEDCDALELPFDLYPNPIVPARECFFVCCKTPGESMSLTVTR